MLWGASALFRFFLMMISLLVHIKQVRCHAVEKGLSEFDSRLAMLGATTTSPEVRLCMYWRRRSRGGRGVIVDCESSEDQLVWLNTCT